MVGKNQPVKVKTQEIPEASPLEKPVPVSLSDQLPDMTDAKLAALRANAERIAGEGKHAKSKAAQDLLPLIAEEEARRGAIRREKDAERRKLQAEKRAKTRQLKKEAKA